MIFISLLYLLSSNAVNLRRDKSILYSRTVIIILLYTINIGKNFLSLFLNESIGLFGGLFHVTSVTQNFNLFIFLISAIILQLTGFYSRKVSIESYTSLYYLFLTKFFYNKTNILNKMAEQFRIIEYPLIMLFINSGAVMLVSSSNIVSIFLSIELQSYGLYLLATLYRNSELSTSAGLTYFLLGGLSSCFIALGTSLLYANSGTTNLDSYYIIANLSNIGNDCLNNILDIYKPLYLNISFLIMSVGFLFKVSAAPFHFWSPDVYDAIPTIVTTFVAIVAKISILIFLLQIVHYTSNYFFTLNFNWTSGLLISSLLSLIIGTVLGLSQSRIKRLLAYSTISHLGFILLALSINSIESVQAFIFYLVQYTLSNLNIFIILISIGYSLYPYVYDDKSKSLEQYNKLLDRNNSPIQLISQIKGYFNINPILALSLAITFFSFVGIPPLVGFFAKQMVLSAALDNGYVFLALVAILTSVISAVYYLSVIKQVYFDKLEYKINYAFERNFFFKGIIVSLLKPKKRYSTTLLKKVTFNVDNIVLSASLTITNSILTLLLLLFIFINEQLFSLSKILSLTMFNP